MRPGAEWTLIAAEPATTRTLFVGYACILAAIPAICGLIGGQVFGLGNFIVHFHPPLVASVISAVVGYCLALASVFLIGLIINMLAPSFDGEKNQIQAMKVAVYSSTAGWVAGVFSLFPPLGIIAVLAGLYGLYLLYTGLPRVMKSPPEKSLGYTVVTILCAIVVSIVAGAVAAAITAPMLMGGLLASASQSSTMFHANGHGTNLAGMQAAASAAAAGPRVGGTVTAVDPDALKALLPDQVGGMPRTELTAESTGAAGVASSNAEAVYAKGDTRIRLRLTDMAAMGALAGMAGAMGIESARETATGYEKIGKVDGRLTTESWDNTAKTGKVSVLVAERFMVQAEGTAPSVEVLKAAVGAVPPEHLASLAKG